MGGGGVTAHQEHMWDFMVIGPSRGYFSDPKKRTLIVLLRNLLREEAYFRVMVVRVVTIIRYLCGFISDLATEKSCINKKVKGWTDYVEVISGVLRRHP